MAGETLCEPVADTVPTPGSIVIDLALPIFHDSFTACPAVISVGSTVNEFIIGFEAAVVRLAVAVGVAVFFGVLDNMLGFVARK